MLSEVKTRLSGLGYEVKEDDEQELNFLIEIVTVKITHFCNVPEIPSDCVVIAVDMVCGEFLLRRKAAGKLEGYDFSPLVTKSIQEGDTTVTFSETNLSTEKQFTDYMSKLTKFPRIEFYHHRRIKW